MVKKISELTPFGLRIPDDLKKQLDRAARRKGQSLNKEILTYIEAGLRGDVDLSIISTEDLVRELLSRNEPGRLVIKIAKPKEN